MRERGILFSGSMVRAILAGQKTVTRRRLSPQPTNLHACKYWDAVPGSPQHHVPWTAPDGATARAARMEHVAKAPAAPGDRLWVREAWRTLAEYDDRPKRAGVPVPEGSLVWYDANPTPDGEPWTGASGHDGCGNWHTVGRYRHARFMPRWASRITLDVVSVRVERLHDITRAEALAEGCKDTLGCDALTSFSALWQDINGVDSWNANPFVWRVEFARAS